MEFHASEIFSRRTQPWKRLSREEARGTIKSVLDVLANAYDTARAFACVVHKASFPNQDPMEIAFEDLTGYPQRPVPRDNKAATALKKRTLTNLYNARPQWLADAHAQLDAAVAAAYGWPADITDDAVLRELLARNRR